MAAEMALARAEMDVVRCVIARWRGGVKRGREGSIDGRVAAELGARWLEGPR